MTGNSAVAAASLRALVPAGVPADVRDAIDWQQDPRDAAIQLVLCEGDTTAAEWRRHLATRDGARVRVVTPVEGSYPLVWLVAERVVSVNTAAAGGNASLMTLGPG